MPACHLLLGHTKLESTLDISGSRLMTIWLFQSRLKFDDRAYNGFGRCWLRCWSKSNVRNRSMPRATGTSAPDPSQSFIN